MIPNIVDRTDLLYLVIRIGDTLWNFCLFFIYVCIKQCGFVSMFVYIHLFIIANVGVLVLRDVGLIIHQSQ